MRLNSRADRAIGLLAGACQTLPNPYLLSRSLMRRESVLSSRIEGTRASLSDLLIHEARREPVPHHPELDRLARRCAC